MPSNHLILCHPLLLLPSIFPRIRIFSNESVLHIWWPKYWSFSFSISPSNDYFFRIDWFDLLAVQGTLKSLLQHHTSKAPVLRHSALFIVQLLHPGEKKHHTGKPISQFSCSFVSDSLWPHGLQHTRLPCPSPTPGVYSISCPLSRWCHPTISSSVVPCLLLPSIFPSIRVFSNESVLHIRQPKYWSFNFSISRSSDQGWFPLGLTDVISLQSKALSRVFSNTTVQKHQFSGTQISLWSNSQNHTWLLEKP